MRGRSLRERREERQRVRRVGKALGLSRGEKAGLGLMLFWLLCYLAFWGAVFYVAVHFIVKWW